MAKLRKFCAYKALERPYTRKSKYRKLSYIRASPSCKVVRFDMGNLRKLDWEYTIQLISKDYCNIRDNSIESARQVANKHLEKMGVENFHFRIRAYPHHMLRENPLASGAGADRLSKGMAASFGKVIGIAARIHPDKVLFEVGTNADCVEKVKHALDRSGTKMPASFRVNVIHNVQKK
jgi:large subunit ribosomal protein L10e